MKQRLRLIILFLVLFIILTLFMSEPKAKIPESIKPEAKLALMHFPELKNTPIEFKFKKDIKKSVMLAQPVWSHILKSKKKRGYKILISEDFKISGKKFRTEEVPSEVLIGWIGHELGHIMDYRQRNGLNLIGFGLGYMFSDNYVRKAERTADSFAVSRGMSDYILKTKNFILGNSEIQDSYKARIKKYYLSPDEILEMVKEQDSLKGIE